MWSQKAIAYFKERLNKEKARIYMETFRIEGSVREVDLVISWKKNILQKQEFFCHFLMLMVGCEQIQNPHLILIIRQLI
jgi:hypothetical protein